MHAYQLKYHHVIQQKQEREIVDFQKYNTNKIYFQAEEQKTDEFSCLQKKSI